MEEKNPYEKVVMMFLKLLGLFVVSPIIFTLALKAKRIYTEGIGLYISYALLVIGAGLLVFAVYYGIRTVQNLLNTLFRDKN